MKTWQSILVAVVLVGFAAQAQADRGDCGQPITDGAHPTASDALYTLKAAVGMHECEGAVCDVDADCQIGASDALLTLHGSLNGSRFDDCATACDEPVACGKSSAPQCGGICPAGEACILDEFGLSTWSALQGYDDDSDSDSDAYSDGTSDVEDDSDGDSDIDDDSDADSDGDSDIDDDSDGGGNTDLHCICFPTDLPTTTTSLPSPTTSTTTTTSTTLPAPSTTTTTLAPPDTTTTTLVAPTTTSSTTTTTSTSTTTLGANPVLGQAIYDSNCMVCHKAGSHDTSGFAPNLAGKAGKLRNNVTSITGDHPSGLVFTDDEIADLAAFLSSL